MNSFAKRFNARKRAKQMSQGFYPARIIRVVVLSDGKIRWDYAITSGEYEGVEVSQINLCQTEVGLDILAGNLELLGIEDDWEIAQTKLSSISDWPVEVEIKHSEQLDRTGKPYINVYLVRNLQPKAA